MNLIFCILITSVMIFRSGYCYYIKYKHYPKPCIKIILTCIDGDCEGDCEVVCSELIAECTLGFATCLKIIGLGEREHKLVMLCNEHLVLSVFHL